MRKIIGLITVAGFLLLSFSASAAPTCVSGQKVEYSSTMTHLEALVVKNGLRVIQIVGDGRPAGSYGKQLLKEAQSGRVNRFVGRASVTFVIHGARNLPSKVPALYGNGYCYGMVQVEKSGTTSRITVPLIGGMLYGKQGLGQASAVIPRAALSGNRRLLVCVTSRDVRFKYLPKLVAGPHKGQSNVLCGLPSLERSGYTYLAYNIVFRPNLAKGNMFSLIQRR